MSARSPLLFLASASLAVSAPVTETYYEWVAPDKTVLCSSKVPGSCDPYADDATGVEEFLADASSRLELSPGRFFGSTDLPIDVVVSADTENSLRLRHTFEDAIDLGWYAFEGGTGDFLMEYSGGSDLQSAGYPDAVSFSFSSPFPLPLSGGVGEAIRRETFGRPFRIKGHHKFALDLLVAPDSICCHEWIIRSNGSSISSALDLDRNPLEFDVRLVPVPIPEPGGLTVLGLSAILAAAIRRGFLY